MTLKLMRALALWSGCMALMVISVLPLSLVAQALSVAGVLMLVAGGWLLAGRRSVRLGGPAGLGEFQALPGSEYRLPVVLVCGQGSSALFAADLDVDIAEQTAVRTTASGCYVSVPNIERLPGLVAALLAARSQWRAQMSVMCVVNPSQHTDSSELDGQLRALTHQLSVVRKRALTLPLWVVSYQQASQDTRDVCGTGFTREEAGSSDPSVWFSWENGRPSARVRSNGTCASVEDWQGQDRAALTHRMPIAVQMNTHGAWLGGIPGSCFAVQGYGASQPIASNDTEHGRRANRRVDIRLVPEEGACGSLSAGAGPATPVAFRGTR